MFIECERESELPRELLSRIPNFKGHKVEAKKGKNPFNKPDLGDATRYS